MDAANRTLLVVEDNQVLNQLYKNFCELAIYELSQEGLPSKATVKQAYDYAEASNMLKSWQDLDFMSVDLSLQDHAPGAKEKDRTVGRDIDGMVLLKELRESKRRTLAVVVSGEGLLSYSVDVLRKYRVLAYFEKSRLDLEKYKHTLKAALWYLEADQIIRKLGQSVVGPDNLSTAGIYWRKAIESAKKAGIDERNLPDDLGAIIDSLRHAYTDPAAQLSTHALADQDLKEKVVGD
jgi:CheY-like chemotaxis protein